jgi:signal transduction histidine kinase
MRAAAVLSGLLHGIAVLATSVTAASQTVPASAQPVLVAAKAVRQPTTQAPLDMTMRSGEHIVVSAADVHEKATQVIREAAARQSGLEIQPSLLYVLDARQRSPFTLFNREYFKVVLKSGAEIGIRVDDLRDPSLTFLQTALLQFVNTETREKEEAQRRASEIAAKAAQENSEIAAKAAQENQERYLAAKAKIQREDEERARLAAAQWASVGASITSIKEKCAQEWPKDFRMQAYCIDQQEEAVKALLARGMDSSDLRTIRENCRAEWLDDFRMRNYCEVQQLEALARIRRR